MTWRSTSIRAPCVPKNFLVAQQLCHLRTPTSTFGAGPMTSAMLGIMTSAFLSGPGIYASIITVRVTLLTIITRATADDSFVSSPAGCEDHAVPIAMHRTMRRSRSTVQLVVDAIIPSWLVAHSDIPFIDQHTPVISLNEQLNALSNCLAILQTANPLGTWTDSAYYDSSSDAFLSPKLTPSVIVATSKDLAAHTRQTRPGVSTLISATSVS